MNVERFQTITDRFGRMRIAVIGDFCLDRYLEIDPAKEEVSIETGRPVHNVVNVRGQPGGAGTILNNLVALGVGTIFPVGFCGTDGEGFELQRVLRAKGAGVHLNHFFATDQRHTFTYCKPLIIQDGQPPTELNRLDTKNWAPTPQAVAGRIMDSVAKLAREADALILLDQVDVRETGVITKSVLTQVAEIVAGDPSLLVLADSRRGLKGFPRVMLKMNRAELSTLSGVAKDSDPSWLKKVIAKLAQQHEHNVFVTLAELGMIGATPTGEVEHVPAFPVRGEIDIVGAGDAVTANLTCALAAGATLRESLELASAAASVVIHQLGTTGTASVSQLRELVLA